MQSLNLFLIGCTCFVLGISLSLISPFYPTEALAKGVSVSQTGLVMGTVFITVVLSTPVFGKYIQILGARKFLIIGSFVGGSGNFIFAFLADVQNTNAFFSLSIVLRFVIALGDSAIGPAAFTLAGRQVTDKHKGKATALVEGTFAVGTMFGPAIGGCLYDLGGFSLPFFVTGIAMMLFSFMSLLLFTEELHDGIQNGSQNVSWMDILKVAGVKIGIFAIFFAGMSKKWYTASLGPFLKNSYGLSSSQIGLVFMPFGLAYTLFAPFVGFITDEGFNSLIIIIVGKLLISLSNMFLGPIPPISSVMGHYLWVTVAAITLQGIGSSFAYIGTNTFMTKSSILCI